MDEPVRPATDYEQLTRAYERHSADAHVREVMSVYAAAHLALERAAAALVALGEHRMAHAIGSRAHDLFLQAIRHLDIIIRRAEDESTPPTSESPPHDPTRPR
jgi:hypothetical protein